jgi:general secretion pathway protein D
MLFSRLRPLGEASFACKIILLIICLTTNLQAASDKTSSESEILLEKQADNFVITHQPNKARELYIKILRAHPERSDIYEKIKSTQKTIQQQTLNQFKKDRENALANVSMAWQQHNNVDNNFSTPTSPATEKCFLPITQKLESIIIPEIKFTDADIEDVITFLNRESREADPQKQGVNFICEIDASAPQQNFLRKITIDLKNTSLDQIVSMLHSLTSLDIKIERSAIVFKPSQDLESTFQIKTYSVSPEFWGDDNPLNSTKTTISNISFDAKNILIKKGIPLPQTASANYFSNSSQLVVRAPESALDLISRMIQLEEDFNISQVEIETKFIEFSETQLDELRFRWQLSADAHGLIPGLENVSPNFLPQPGKTGVGGETAGLRGATPDALTPTSGIGANSIDSLLLVGGTQASPTSSNIRFAGILNGRGATLMLNMLESVTGANLMSAPRLTLKQGHQGTVKIVREFIYPATYTKPQIPENGIITPANPQDFNYDKPKNVGVVLTVKAEQICPETQLIDLDIPEVKVTDFDGYINYGSDVTTFNQDSGQTERLVEGVALQPVFTVRRASTHVQLHDGESLMIGGLIRDDIQEVHDKVPVLGDVPLLGALFRSKAKQDIKRNLVIISTAHIISHSGQPLFNKIPQGL